MKKYTFERKKKRDTGGLGRRVNSETKKKDKKHLVSVSYIKD